MYHCWIIDAILLECVLILLHFNRGWSTQIHHLFLLLLGELGISCLVVSRSTLVAFLCRLSCQVHVQLLLVCGLVRVVDEVTTAINLEYLLQLCRCLLIVRELLLL